MTEPEVQFTLPDDQVKLLQGYLRGTRCRICNHDDFVINNMLVFLPAFAPPRPDGQTMGGIMILVSCAMCGHVEFFNGRQFGVGWVGTTPGA